MKNPHVAAIGKLNLSGNIIPSIWWQRLRLESGAVDYASVIILAEIIYWFKPTIVRDERSGLILEIKQKFRADKLQRSYQSFADQFGLSKKQVREAMQRLVERELITTEFRIITVNNTPLNNVLFIDVNPQKIEALSSITQSDKPYCPASDTLLPQRETGSYPIGKEGVIPQGKTYTDTSTNNSTDISTKITAENTAPALDQNPLDNVETSIIEEQPQIIPTLINGFNDLEESQLQSQTVKNPIVKEKVSQKRKRTPAAPTPDNAALQDAIWAFVQRDPYWSANRLCKTPTSAFKLATTTSNRERGLMAQFLESQPKTTQQPQATPPSEPDHVTMNFGGL